MPLPRLFKAFYSSLIFYNKFNIVLVIISWFNKAPSLPMLKVLDSESEFSELVEFSLFSR